MDVYDEVDRRETDAGEMTCDEQWKEKAHELYIIQVQSVTLL